LRRRIPLDVAVESALGSRSLESRDAGFAVAIATETLRRFGQLQAAVHQFIPKLPPQHRAGPTLEILLAAACELLFLNVAPHAAVDAANELAASDSRAVHFKSLINAVLRRLAREGEALISAQDAPRLNTPDWLWARWSENFGEDVARRIAAAHLSPPPLDVQKKSDAVMVPEGIALPGGVVRISSPGRIDEISGYREGEWWVQDFAATLPARLFGDVRSKTVIDLCAAPGGKTSQLAANGAHVIAVERDPARTRRLRENLSRLKLRAEVVEADVRDFAPKERAPFVLLDAPCSATGTIRRHPDLPWNKSAADIGLCAHGAGELLDAAADMVAEGGLLVFAVCSLEPEEGHQQVELFLSDHKEFRKEPVQAEELYGMPELMAGGALRTLPCHLAAHGGMDGFYAVRLRRSG
jgi:16S rRNA (cytosine967-C5)-methyltransferase